MSVYEPGIGNINKVKAKRKIKNPMQTVRYPIQLLVRKKGFQVNSF